MAIMRVVAPDRVTRGAGFEALRIGAAHFDDAGDPFLNIDHFRMSTVTFPPHPHAGFSAVTYLLPESFGSMLNRDGRGDRSKIDPGGVHWTAAGSGLVHEEVPEPAGSLAEGLQIFVRQPEEQERLPAMIYHVDPDDVPVVKLNAGSWVRVVAGRFNESRAPFEPPSPLQILDVALAPGSDLEWTTPAPGSTVTLYLFSGTLDIDGTEVIAPNFVVFARGTAVLRLAATLTEARCVLFAGLPLNQPSVSGGPFVLSSRQAVEDAFARYHRGEMGSIVN